MEQNRIDSRERLLRPGLAIIFAALGLAGVACPGPWYVRHACAWFAAVATVILVAQSVDKVLSGRGPVDVADPPAFRGRPRFRVPIGLGTLLLIATVAGTLLGLSVWNRVGYCGYAYPGYVYGFPFRCLNVPDFGDRMAIDFLLLAADITVGVALVVGSSMEAKNIGSRRR
jgi:hypothetical protein